MVMLKLLKDSEISLRAEAMRTVEKAVVIGVVKEVKRVEGAGSKSESKSNIKAELNSSSFIFLLFFISLRPR